MIKKVIYRCLGALMLGAALVLTGCGRGMSERDAIDFLYESMSIADIGDYDSTFFLENVRTSLRARKEMPWGRKVPQDLFKHFVLPVRVNNERLDDFRVLYYDTLKARVAGLSMRDAALEVNHWCHEKMTYIPSDARTFSPMASILNAEGRCGEESTFAVAAMRAVGIPARQVYTPRWAHTDDNHAWVEVWTDGKWSFLGACEPAANLNMAWFNEPAARAMLMHTLVYGDYRGSRNKVQNASSDAGWSERRGGSKNDVSVSPLPHNGDGRGNNDEDVIRRTHSFTEINVIGNYVKTRNNIVTVKDMDGHLVQGADVSFCIYNYGELYPAVTLVTGPEGDVSLHTGLGDMPVWAVKDGKYGIGLLSYGEEDVPSGSAGETGPDCELTLTLEYDDLSAFAQNFDIAPPEPGKIPFEASEEAIAANKVRLSQEDSIRHAYTSTFLYNESARKVILNTLYGELCDVSEDGAGEFSGAKAMKYPLGAPQQLVDAKGNWRQIMEFLRVANERQQFARAVSLLESLSRKDLKDTKAEVLEDALFTAAQPSGRVAPQMDLGVSAADNSIDNDVYRDYVLCPRVSGEFLQPYHEAIRSALKGSIPEEGNVAQAVIDWTGENIQLADSLNPRRLQATPAGVLKVRKADSRSRDIFVVAALRSFGVPARVDVLTGKPQYLLPNVADGARLGASHAVSDRVLPWIDVKFDVASSCLETAPEQSPAESQGGDEDQMNHAPNITPKGWLVIDYTPGEGVMDNPEYYRHFTLTRIKDGRRHLLEFDGGDATELGADASARSFSRPFSLDEGTYMLTTGTRLASGKVLSRIVTFRVEAFKTTNVQMIMCEGNDEISVIGTMDPEALYQKVIPDPESASSVGSGVESSILSTTGRGYFMLAVLGASDEPSNHALRDIDYALRDPDNAADYDAPSGDDETILTSQRLPLLVLSSDMAAVNALFADIQWFNGLSRVAKDGRLSYGVDKDWSVRQMLCTGCHSTSNTLPVIAVCDSFGRIVYLSTGYNTSLASQLQSVLGGI